MSIDPKNRSMICRMAGNIAGPMLAESSKEFSIQGAKALPPDFFEVHAKSAVLLALAILEEVEYQIEES